MALLEDQNVCCICDAAVVGYAGGVPRYFCHGCYETYKGDILESIGWVMSMLKVEKARRKRRNRALHHGALPVLVSLEPPLQMQA
jgi:hypothetical protein